MNEFDLYHKERALNLRECLSKVINGFEYDQVLSTMREDPNTAAFACQRMKEVVDNKILANNEVCLNNLFSENILLK